MYSRRDQSLGNVLDHCLGNHAVHAMGVAKDGCICLQRLNKVGTTDIDQIYSVTIPNNPFVLVLAIDEGVLQFNDRREFFQGQSCPEVQARVISHVSSNE